MKFNCEELIGEELYDAINKLNIDNNLIFYIKKTKGRNEKFNQNKTVPIVVRVNQTSKKTIEIVVSYY